MWDIVYEQTLVPKKLKSPTLLRMGVCRRQLENEALVQIYLTV